MKNEVRYKFLFRTIFTYQIHVKDESEDSLNF